jgi:hypothetical protein
VAKIAHNSQIPLLHEILGTLQGVDNGYLCSEGRHTIFPFDASIYTYGGLYDHQNIT